MRKQEAIDYHAKETFISKFVHSETFQRIRLYTEHAEFIPNHYWAPYSSFSLTVSLYITSIHCTSLVDKCRSCSIPLAIQRRRTLLQFWRGLTRWGLALRWDCRLTIRASWTTVFMRWRVLALMLVVRCLRLLLSIRAAPRVALIVPIPRWLIWLFTGRHSRPWTSVALLHEHMRLAVWHKRLLLLSLEGRLHVVGTTSITRAFKLWLHHALWIPHRHSMMVTRITLMEIFISLTFLIIFIASLTLSLGILLRQRRSTFACSTAETSGFTWICIDSWKLLLILFANYI